MFRFAHILCLVAGASLAAAHTVIVYPGWRGNNLHTNGTVSDTDISIKPGSLGITYEGNGTVGFPFGGAVSLQPGWFPGHANAQFYVNMGYGNEPLNYSHAMVSTFSITGPTNAEYNATLCLPQVPLPANYSPKAGDNATIQVIELAQHGAALYNCADITFAEDDDPEIPEVTDKNCYNSTDPDQLVQFQLVYTTTSNPAAHTVALNTWMSLLVPLMLGVAMTWL